MPSLSGRGYLKNVNFSVYLQYAETNDSDEICFGVSPNQFFYYSYLLFLLTILINYAVLTLLIIRIFCGLHEIFYYPI